MSDKITYSDNNTILFYGDNLFRSTFRHHGLSCFFSSISYIPSASTEPDYYSFRDINGVEVAKIGRNHFNSDELKNKLDKITRRNKNESKNL